jgi:hypothetical protein
MLRRIVLLEFSCVLVLFAPIVAVALSANRHLFAPKLTSPHVVVLILPYVSERSKDSYMKDSAWTAQHGKRIAELVSSS